MNKTFIIVLDVIAILALLVVAYIYLTHPANQLPAWLPGHNATETKVHLKHGLAAIVVALGAAAFGWFQTGPKPTSDSANQ